MGTGGGGGGVIALLPEEPDMLFGLQTKRSNCFAGGGVGGGPLGKCGVIGANLGVDLASKSVVGMSGVGVTIPVGSAGVLCSNCRNGSNLCIWACVKPSAGGAMVRGILE